MNRRLKFVWYILVVVFVACNSNTPVYMNPEKDIEDRVDDLVKRMTLEEKIEQLSGLGFDTPENTRLGIPSLKMADGPAGVRWGTGTAFPAPIALAATWDTALMYKVGKAMALEMKLKGRNFLLAPCINLIRHPLGGRNFESYGEDPFLTSRIAVSFIKGVQDNGVIACAKHFACNNQEWRRHDVDVEVSERALREYYLRAFEAAVKEANVLSVMSAYNVFRGRHCSENSYLLNDILKKEWSFKGFVVSDWGSTYSTVNTANAGLDLEMPYGKFFSENLLEAVQNGDVSIETIDDKLKRLMRARFSVGLFDEHYSIDSNADFNTLHKGLALQAAMESIVLLKNDNNSLPLNLNEVRSIAVIGPNAAVARVGGGGSSQVNAPYAISPLDGLKNILGSDIEIRYSPGIEAKGDVLPIETQFFIHDKLSAGSNGLYAEYFANKELDGEPVLTRIDETIDFNWGYDSPDPLLHEVNDRNIFSVRWSGSVITRETGDYTFNAINNDGVRLYIDGKIIIDEWTDNTLSRQSSGSIYLDANSTYDIIVEYYFDGGISEIKLGWDMPRHDPLMHAVETAKNADLVIVYAGFSNHFESESFDRPYLDMPNQSSLINAIAKVNQNIVVVLQTGSPVLIDEWVNNVPAVLQAWYGGQEGGTAITQVLLGKHNPSGKLPFTFANQKDELPAFKAYKDESLDVQFEEDIFVGYKYFDKENIKPVFSFGHGLSYTCFAYNNLVVNDTLDNCKLIRFDLINVGRMKGTEVVQLYVGDTDSDIVKPKLELKGFLRVELKSGESASLEFLLDDTAFSFFDENSMTWKSEAGEYLLSIGSSSARYRLRRVITYSGNVTAE